MNQRKASYGAYIAALSEQYSAQEATLEQMIRSERKKAENARKAIQQWDERNEAELKETLGKSSARRRQSASLDELKEQIRDLGVEKQTILRELKLVRDEAESLSEENRALKHELSLLRGPS